MTPPVRLDPRLRLAATAIFAIAVSLAPEGRWEALAALAILLAQAWKRAQSNGHDPIRAWQLLIPVTLLSLPVGFTTPGPALVVIPGLGWTLTSTGLSRQAGLVVRTALSVGATVLLAARTPVTDLIWALEKLGLPPRLAQVIGLMSRYLSLGTDEARRMLRARAAREATLPGGAGPRWSSRVRWAGAIVGSLLVRSLERSERVWMAMAARGHGRPVAARGPRPFRGASFGECIALASGLAITANARWGTPW